MPHSRHHHHHPQPPSIFHIILRLSRAKMTLTTAVTHLAAAIVSTLSPQAPPFSISRYLRSWLFILLTQFSTHFFGEVHDQVSDKLNLYSTPLSGGSRVLVHKLVSANFIFRLAFSTLLLSIFSLFFVVPSEARPIAIAMVTLAMCYTAPPLKLNHRGLGELDAAIITSFLVPHYSAVAQTAVPLFPILSPSLYMLVIPPVFAKIALFLALNQADRRPDWTGGKVTLPVILGDRATALLHAALCIATYFSAAVIATFRILAATAPSAKRAEASIIFFLIPGAIVAFRLSRAMLRGMPYKLDPLLPSILLHTTCINWGIVLHAIFFSPDRGSLLSPQYAFLAVLAWLTLRNYLKPRRERARAGTGKQIEDAQEVSVSKKNDGDLKPGQSVSTSQRNGDDTAASNASPSATVDASASTTQTTETTKLDYDVVVVGAGVGGLVAALTLQKLGRSVLVLERRQRSAVSQGADIALWPGAISIIRHLGVPDDFFKKDTYPIHTVHMCNMDFSGTESLGKAPQAKILKTLDMTAATEGTGEQFVLVSRGKLMEALWALVPSKSVVCGAQVTKVSESEELQSVTVNYRTSSDGDGEHSVSGRIAIGADGAGSILRRHVHPTLGAASAVRFCGEVCYRGVLPLDDKNGVGSRVSKLFPDGLQDATKRISYGAGLRSSFGYLNSCGTEGYWWVKVPASEAPTNKEKLSDCTWPEPLKTLHDLTPDDLYYVDSIVDSVTLPRWSSNRVALVGDAAHVVTPNMAQGACLATEDAFVLAVELGKHWSWPDGHVEAFYRYEICRKPFAEGVASESRKQLFLGQLSSPIGVWLRETLLKMVPTSVLIKKLRQNNFEQLPTYVETFTEMAQ